MDRAVPYQAQYLKAMAAFNSSVPLLPASENVEDNVPMTVSTSDVAGEQERAVVDSSADASGSRETESMFAFTHATISPALQQKLQDR